MGSTLLFIAIANFNIHTNTRFVGVKQYFGPFGLGLMRLGHSQFG
jgi:hypothetical protein